MPPRLYNKLLTVIRLLVILSFVAQSFVPLVATAAPVAAKSVRQLNQEDPPVDPIAEFEDGFQELPPVPPLQPNEEIIDYSGPPTEAPKRVEMELPPLVEEERSPQPISAPIDQPGADVPVQVEVSQDRYVMVIGETTHVSLTVYPTAGQDPTPVQLTLTPSSNLVTITNNSWSVPPLHDGENFLQQVNIQIAAGELPPSGAVITFTVEANAANFRPMTRTLWLGLLPESVPLPNTSNTTDTVSISALTFSQQSEQGSVLQRTDASGNNQFLLLAAPGAVPPDTKFTYTHLTPVAVPTPKPPSIPTASENPLYLPSVKSDNNSVIARSSEISTVAPITTINGVGIYSMWHLTATQTDGSGVNHFDQPVLLVLSVDEWVAAGLDMNAMQILTREDNSHPWQIQPARYDETRQVWVTNARHFSDFALGTGLGSGFDLLPTMSGLTQGGYTGAVNYNYPIEAPSGLGGLNPNISLSYSSNVPDSVAMNTDSKDSKIQASPVGYGWDISGIGYIARVQLPQHKDEEYYTMVINGQRVDILGTNATGYHTNPELFAQIQYAQTSTSSMWIVTMPNGTIYTFGGVTANADVDDADVTMVVASTSTSAYALKFDRWMLTRVEDTSGNYMDYSYKSERRATSTSDSACTSASPWYSSSIVLDRVRWSANNTSNPVVSPMLQMRFVYGTGTDTGLQYDGTFCRQLKATSKRLSSIVVEVFEANGVTEHVIRSYTLRHDTVDGSTRSSNDGNLYRHLLLKEVTQLGNDGGALHTTHFAYENIKHNNEWSVNNVRLREIVTPFGAIIRYEYSFVDTVNCGPDADDYPCFDGFWPVTTMTVFNGLTNGRNSWTKTKYSYSTARYHTYNALTHFDRITEWLGVVSSTETTYEATDTDTTGPIVCYLYTEYYRLYPNTEMPDPRKGRIFRQELYNASGGTLYYRSKLKLV